MRRRAGVPSHPRRNPCVDAQPSEEALLREVAGKRHLRPRQPGERDPADWEAFLLEQECKRWNRDAA